MSEIKDVFISYGRKQSLAFARKLYTRLNENGYTAWFDFENIPTGDDYQKRIDNGIEMAHNFVYIISPHSVASPYCGLEVDLAVKYGKRIIPINHVESDFEQMRPVIKEAKPQWILARQKWEAEREIEDWADIDDFENAFAKLIECINIDRDYVHHHTIILNRALKWERKQKTEHFLLTGAEREAAEKWLLTEFNPAHQPACYPAELHGEYICESMKNSDNLMTTVFMAYSEAQHDVEMMAKFNGYLQRRGITTWFRTRDNKYSNFEKGQEIGIRQADNVIFFISPQSMESPLLKKEFTIAQEYNKRILPILVESTTAESMFHGLPELIGDGSDFTDIPEVHFQKKMAIICQQIQSDAEYYYQHKVFLVQAHKWQKQRQNPSILLRGYNLKKAIEWLKQAEIHENHLALPLQKEFIIASQVNSTDVHTDVFISYSRVNSEFARKLNDELQLNGKITWFDQESIASGADFAAEIKQGIANADNFVFIISPPAIESDYCAEEVNLARQQNKRIIGLLYEEVDTDGESWRNSGLAGKHWIDVRPEPGDFDSDLGELLQALEYDRAYIREHNKWLYKAREWAAESEQVLLGFSDQKNANLVTFDDLLLKEKECRLARRWLDQAVAEQKSPPPTKLHKLFIEHSENALECQQMIANKQEVIAKFSIDLETFIQIIEDDVEVIKKKHSGCMALVGSVVGTLVSIFFIVFPLYLMYSSAGFLGRLYYLFFVIFGVFMTIIGFRSFAYISKKRNIAKYSVALNFANDIRQDLMKIEIDLRTQRSNQTILVLFQNIELLRDEFYSYTRQTYKLSHYSQRHNEIKTKRQQKTIKDMAKAAVFNKTKSYRERLERLKTKYPKT